MSDVPQASIAATSIDGHRAAAWAAAQGMGEFGAAEIAQITGTSIERAELIIRGWLVDGAVEIAQMRVGSARQLVRVVPGSEPSVKPRNRTPEENMWHTFRRLRTASPTDLAAHATTDSVTVTVEDAAAYCRALLAAGYLRVSRKASPKSARLAIYNLARDTGPKPPKPKRVRAVVDPNTGDTHLIGGAA